MRRAVIIGAAALIAVMTLGFSIELLRGHFVSQQVAANYVTLPFAGVLAALTIATALAVRRPSLAGALLFGAAAGAGVGAWRFSTHPWLAAVGFCASFATALLPLHAAVEHGTGVPRGVRRMLIVATGALAVLTIVMVTTAPPGTLDRWFVAIDVRRHARNEFLLYGSRGLARAALVAWWIVLLAAGCAGLAGRIIEWRRAPRGTRRAEAPVVGGAAAWVVLAFGSGACMLVARVEAARAALADYGAIIVPIIGLAVVATMMAWVELVRPRLGRVRGSTIEMRAIEPDDVELRALLDDVLATRGVELAYARGDGWVDARGREVSLPHGKRRATIVRRGGTAVAALVHDADVPFGAIELGARLAGAQLEAQRATALARSRADEVRAGTGELVRAGDRAARSISRRLEAEPIPALAELSAGLRAHPDAIAEVPGRLQAVTAEVRRVSHGLFPRALDHGGLAAVLPADQVPARRLPPPLELTVYLLANECGAVIGDEGSHLRARCARPVPAEVAARATALGGQIDGTVVVLPLDAE